MLHRRHLLAAAPALLAAPAVSAQTAGFPNRTIRLLVGFAPGGTTDVAARLFPDTLVGKSGMWRDEARPPGINGGLPRLCA